MQFRKPVLFTALALTSVLALSGCAPESANPEPSATSPIYEIPSVENVVAGDVVDTEQAVSLNELDAKPGFRAYEMSDGTFVVVDSSVPLPENIVADLQSQVDALPAEDEALGDFVFAKNIETGRNVVVIAKVPTPAGIEAGAPVVNRWVHYGDPKQEAFMRPDMYIGQGTSDEYLAELYADGVANTLDNLEVFVQ